jgi:nucleotide-binding universal stress UspA family protein
VAVIQIRHVLCPVDFSDASRRAFAHAVVIAKWYDASIALLHVYRVPPIVPAAPEVLPAVLLTPEYRGQLLESLQRFAEASTGSTIPLHYEIRDGLTATEIVAKAGEIPADLIVMGTHGVSGFERLLLGSVTEKVLRKAVCPVLTVPPAVSDAVPASPQYKRILCAIDFSDCSMHALEYATSLAQEADASLTVLHVFELEGTLPSEWRNTFTPQGLRDRLVELERERSDKLSHAVPDTVRTYCTVETMMRAGKPYREILRVADELQSELIVIGVRGRTAADVFFFGSTANHVVRQATCPVLSIRT